jgi:acetyltransferase-like isoleucine patch superfamily enzyme
MNNLYLLIIVLLLSKYIIIFFVYLLCFVLYNIHNRGIRIGKEMQSSSIKKNSFANSLSGLVFYAIIQTGKIPSHFIRRLLYIYIFKVKLGMNAVIYCGAEIRSPDKLVVGKGSIIGHHSILDARNIIEIGENVNFSTGVWLWTEQHNYNNHDFSCDSPKNKKIIIHDRVWLGPRVTVLPGITIGEGAVVGAGAVVTKDIDPFTINVGIPAKKIGDRNKNLTYIFNDNPLPFV